MGHSKSSSKREVYSNTTLPQEKRNISNKKNVDKNEDLLKEVQQLRMENEYLKKLNALVQERIKRENKKK